MTSLTIPNSVTKIGLDAFRSCNKLSTVSIPNTLETISDNAFYYCSKLSSIEFPEYLKSIGSNAFYNCKLLKSIKIHKWVNAIGAGAFSGCSGLASIYAYAPIPLTLESNSGVFTNVNKSSCILYVPEGSKSAYQSATIWNEFLSPTEFNAVTSLPILNDNHIQILYDQQSESLKLKGLTENASLVIYNMSGKVVMYQTISNDIDYMLNELSDGIYIVKLRTAKGECRQKIQVSNRH